MSNVDLDEIAKFEALAATWWDPQGQSRPLHQINPLRTDFIQHNVGGLAGKQVADIGCGGGLLAESMAMAGANVTAIDMAEASIQVAKLHALESKLNIDYQQVTAEKLVANQAESFDVVTCMEMIEHVPDPASVIHACADLLKPGGWLILSTLNRTFKSRMLAIVAAENILKWLPKGTHDYDKFLKPSELLQYTDEKALQPKQMKGFRYNPIKDSFSIGNDVDVNYIVACYKPENVSNA
ncbi:bifunctional 2-polyprenyl-6-hydroxyphenol methylase/3-demethylubiquinol 3-O-methyltransferase UbiG [Echinimonas agarilytica]|uniref:Ubiquinone biosynthesis O-methyltransferase n=1 Tax=Echinimonas agarilytica TaxID=1215918 RepID=A0AA41W937_9GAMM|nr:bifunctional 2-polyprenyl-6-hydroxyphenol methylase/3-demethylubiquinol 3-O-methyltransferase UbiG [Echinimonas agarilytica]MCM2680837.1 bifunctional 2-polyprenyl-6-hydroxyphenol methylase/3-demethylubiquinol 3-O-methyltransferase UbiG [Echinimonas agarilytica]